jgi:hypothetical protein
MAQSFPILTRNQDLGKHLENYSFKTNGRNPPVHKNNYSVYSDSQIADQTNVNSPGASSILAKKMRGKTNKSVKIA